MRFSSSRSAETRVEKPIGRADDSFDRLPLVTVVTVGEAMSSVSREDGPEIDCWASDVRFDAAEGVLSDEECALHS